MSDPDGAKARERKRRYRAVCVVCGGPCYRQGPYAAWRCEACERTHRHEQRKWTKRKVKAALGRWADDLGRPPTAEETALPGTRVPYGAIRREFGSFSQALKAAGLPAREPGHRAASNGLPDRAERPWADGGLQQRFHTRDRRRKPNYRLPQLEVKLGYRPLTTAQQRELRAQWIAARVILHDLGAEDQVLGLAGDRTRHRSRDGVVVVEDQLGRCPAQRPRVPAVVAQAGQRVGELDGRL